MTTTNIQLPSNSTNLTSEVRMSEVISALSYALDITEGQPEGHAVRSCLIGLRIAEKIGLSEERKATLFYALLLKDLGCSSNAAKMCWLFQADDRKVKRDIKLVEWTSLLKVASFSLGQVLPGSRFTSRLGKVLGMAMEKEDTSRDLIRVRCERGADITRMLGFPDATAQAILDLDEHWDGKGHPLGLSSDEISLEGRICSIAQTMEVFIKEHGIKPAVQVARRRSGKWFDPELVNVFCSLSKDKHFQRELASSDPATVIQALEPTDHIRVVDQSMLDRLAFAFSQVIDAKSPWTQRHSEGVAEIAKGIAGTMCYSEEKQNEIYRAGLLHDVGKLGVSNLILDKPDQLTDDEFEQMRSHALHTNKILERISSFRHFADYASAHHERLDGKGYHRGLAGEMVVEEARILAVADVCEALTAKRPYRDSMPAEKVLSIIQGDTGTAFCPKVVDAFLHYQNETDLFTRLQERSVDSDLLP